MASLNFSAEAFESTANYSPVPAGTYNVTIFNVEIVQVKNGENAGKNQFSIQFRISDGPAENRRVFTYVPLYAGKAQWKTLAFFKALGYEPEPGKPFEIPTPNDLSGKALSIKVAVVPDNNGGETNNVSGFQNVKGSSAVDNLMSTLGATPASTDPFATF